MNLAWLFTAYSEYQVAAGLYCRIRDNKIVRTLAVTGGDYRGSSDSCADGLLANCENLAVPNAHVNPDVRRRLFQGTHFNRNAPTASSHIAFSQTRCARRGIPS
jgi:hypothetical protein